MENNKIKKLPIATTFGSYGYGWQQFMKHFLYFLAIMLIVTIADAPFSKIRDMDWDSNPTTYLLQMLGMAYVILFLPVIEFGGDLLLLRGIRDEELEIGELFIGFKKNYLNIVLANLVTLAVIIIGFIFFIVPGIIVACRLAFVSFLVMDKNMEPMAAIEKSWAMTKGHGWRIFGMALLAIPIFIAGLICFIVGAFVAFVWIKSAFASLYHAIDLEEEKALYNWQGTAI